MNHQSRNEERRLRELTKREHTLFGGVIFGIDGHVIELQARAGDTNREGWSAVVTGMARKPVGESIDRIRGAFASCEITPPPLEVLINLAPAELPKDGTWLDLPLAVIILQALGELPDLAHEQEDELILMGELGLHGDVRRVRGALAMAFAAKPGQLLLVPRDNERECALVTANPDHKGCKVASVAHLREVIEFFKGTRKLNNVLSQPLSFEPVIQKAADFAHVKGQELAKEACTIAAAGGHNLLLIGPPGEGKSLLASAMPGILPRLSNPEKVALTRIYSACGELEKDGQAVTRRPMRPVHHTASRQSLVGGGSDLPKPGEVTLAHLGVLFLDELAEFPRSSIEALRQPIENGEISISRVGGTLTFPSRFTLLAAMNPCPCGYLGTELCRCKPQQVKKYLSKISGPIVDRIDLQVEMSRLTTEERFAEAPAPESDNIRARVEAARERQSRRYSGTAIPFNAGIPGGAIREYCRFTPEALDRYKAIVEQNTLTTRTMDRLAKVARTVADLEGAEDLHPSHLDSAARFVVGGVLRDSF